MAIETVITIVIGVEDGPDSVDDYISDYTAGPIGPARLANLLNRVAGGSMKGVVMAASDEADGTESYVHATCTQATMVAEETMSILGVTFTFKTSGASTDPLAAEINIGSDDDTLCDNCFAAINAHPKLRDLVHASEDAGDANSFFVQYRCPGSFNFGTVSESTTGIVWNNSTFAGGAVGTQQSNTRGWQCGLHGSDPAALTT